MAQKFYFMVDKKKKIIDNIHLFETFGYYKPGAQHKGEDDDEVFMYAYFATEALLEAWEAVPGVDPLPHALEADQSVKEDHMVKLHPHLDVTMEEVEVLVPFEGTGNSSAHGNGNGNGNQQQQQQRMVKKTVKQFRDKHTGAVLNKHHNTRTLVNQIAKNRDPNFKFRLF